MKLQQNLIGLINKKSIIECVNKNFLFTKKYTKKLYSYIDGYINLSFSEIEGMLDFLIGCMTITLDLECSELEFLRARKCEEGPFSNVSELSYIQNPQNNFPKLGRLNKSASSLFYASIINSKSDEGLKTALSEANASTHDRFNILRSHQKSGTTLALRAIGIWDYIRKNNKPCYMSEDVYQYYLLAYKEMTRAFSPELLQAYTLADKFLADIMCRKGSERLYQITSIASSIMLDSENIDGIIYSSVPAKGKPVIALKPNAVRKTLEHHRVTQVLVQEDGNYVNEKIANINKENGELEWKDIIISSKALLNFWTWIAWQRGRIARITLTYDFLNNLLTPFSVLCRTADSARLLP